jgi:HPt (histidine-containing phosphotransfer) domain-containing protein
MAGFLVKPFSEKELFDVVSRFWNSERSVENIEPEPKINPDDLEKIAASDPGFFKEMILLYFKTSENGLKTLEKAVAEKNWETVSETAHKMAAPSKHLKAENLYKKLKMLENAPEIMQMKKKFTNYFLQLNQKQRSNRIFKIIFNRLGKKTKLILHFFNAEKKWLSSTS